MLAQYFQSVTPSPSSADYSTLRIDRLLFISTYGVSVLLQLFLVGNSGLFADEAFYWLEGQFLDWSYSEVPGWVPWIHALTEKTLPHGYFFIRLPHILAASAIPWIGMSITQLISPEANSWRVGLLFLALPLLSIAGTLGIPDIWIVLFTMLSFWILIAAIQYKEKRYYLLLGIMIATGINIHIRFWLIIFVTGLTTISYFFKEKTVIRYLMIITLPISLLGLIPIAWFNIENHFPLLQFQLVDRHPWKLQLQHLYYLPIQIILCSPLLFLLIAQTVWRAIKHQRTEIKLIALTALIHWLAYALLGFYTDNSRLNIHWSLVSYTLLLSLTGFYPKRNLWFYCTFFSGWLCSIILLTTLAMWNQQKHMHSLLQQRITKHTIGWKNLAQHTKKILKPNQLIIADHFITASQLAYELNTPEKIRVLPHASNKKHGRQKQLEIMGLKYDPKKDDGIIIIEQSALKLQDQANYYDHICQLTGGLKKISQLDIGGIKKYHLYHQQEKHCDMPTLFYLNIQKQVIEGWVVTSKKQFKNLSLLVDGLAYPLNQLIEYDLKKIDYLSKIDNTNYLMLGFKITQPQNKKLKHSYHIRVENKDGSHEISRIFKQ